VTWELEDKSPGGLKVLLSSPRWERQLLKFLELSGVDRIVEDGANEEERRTIRPDGWIAWKGSRRISNFSRSAAAHYLPFPFICTLFVKRNLYHVICALRTVDFFCRGSHAGAPASFFCLDWVTVLVWSPYSSGARDKNESKIHK